ncbi:MAG: ClpXP protease specificity-enhancing factor [Pseudomonadales bacterium]
MTQARPKRPYLLRALYDWIVDSDLTPYLLVGVDSDAVQVPREYVTDGKIVLNVGPQAVRDLDLSNEEVTFSGRFGGRPFPIRLPMASILAVYAKETGEGMVFDPEYGNPDDEPEPPEPPSTGHLKVVK